MTQDPFPFRFRTVFSNLARSVSLHVSPSGTGLSNGSHCLQSGSVTLGGQRRLAAQSSSDRRWVGSATRLDHWPSLSAELGTSSGQCDSPSTPLFFPWSPIFSEHAPPISALRWCENTMEPLPVSTEGVGVRHLFPPGRQLHALFSSRQEADRSRT